MDAHWIDSAFVWYSHDPLFSDIPKFKQLSMHVSVKDDVEVSVFICDHLSENPHCLHKNVW